MLINVKVVPRAKKINIKQEASGLKVYLTAPATEGKANRLLTEVLAGHFNVRKSSIKIIRGENLRQKVIQIDDL